MAQTAVHRCEFLRVATMHCWRVNETKNERDVEEWVNVCVRVLASVVQAHKSHLQFNSVLYAIFVHFSATNFVEN